jgi:Lhr-like helicase
MIRGSVKTFAPDLQLYSGGSPMVSFNVVEDAKTGKQRSIVFHAPKGSKEKGPVTLVFANKVDKEKEVAIVLDSTARQMVSLRVLKSELANNKLAYISPDKFFITKKDTEILYINILQEKNVQFNVLIDAQPVSVSLCLIDYSSTKSKSFP